VRLACVAAATQTEDYSSANSFMVCGVDNAFSLDDFKGRFSIDVTSLGAPPLAAAAPHACVAVLRWRCALRTRHARVHVHAPRARAAPPARKPAALPTPRLTHTKQCACRREHADV
jgi:hypothetical protein